MKKFRFILPILTAVLVLPSCLGNDEGDYPSYVAFATVHVSQTTEAGYYLSLDDRKTVYPGDVSRIGNYDTTEKDGKRTIVYFNLLEQPSEGYDYNAALYSIYDVLTKEVETAATEAELEAFGDDCIRIEDARISNDWLNVFYCMPTDGTTLVKHRLSLVDNQTITPPADAPPGYTYLEFRHHADGDTAGRIVQDYVSFKLGEYAPSVTGSKGLYLKIKPLTGNTTYLKIEPAEK